MCFKKKSLESKQKRNNQTKNNGFWLLKPLSPRSKFKKKQGFKSKMTGSMGRTNWYIYLPTHAPFAKKTTNPMGSMGLVNLPTFSCFFGFYVGKYTVRPMDPSWECQLPCQLFFLLLRLLCGLDHVINRLTPEVDRNGVKLIQILPDYPPWN